MRQNKKVRQHEDKDENRDKGYRKKHEEEVEIFIAIKYVSVSE